MCGWGGSGKVKGVRAGGGFLGGQRVQRENRKGIQGHGWAEAGRKHVGEGCFLTARNHFHFLASYLLFCVSFMRHVIIIECTVFRRVRSQTAYRGKWRNS